MWFCRATFMGTVEVHADERSAEGAVSTRTFSLGRRDSPPQRLTSSNRLTLSNPYRAPERKCDSTRETTFDCLMFIFATVSGDAAARNGAEQHCRTSGKRRSGG